VLELPQLNSINKLRKFFRLKPEAPSAPDLDMVEVHAHRMPIIYRRHARARNYVLRLQSNRTVVVTVPRSGNKSFARDFVASRQSWLEKQWRILETRKIPPHVLQAGMEILFRGQPVKLEIHPLGLQSHLRFGTETAFLPEARGNLRPALESHLQNLARAELAVRVRELAGLHQLDVKKIVIRNQKSRWGSCSYNGTISLNWRLIQLPPEVSDYIIVHELMHLRELNHSPRFWAEVERVCPNYRTAEDWLKRNSGQVGF
jgi:predicted metal-dependent hydrolase